MNAVLKTASEPPKLFVKTQGCQMNEYDSSRMADALRESHGYRPVASAEEADLILLNTCSIREKAQEKVFHQLGRWKRLKARNPDLLIGVGGCVASQEGAAVARRAPFVDIVFGPQTLHRLPQLVEQAKARVAGAVVDVSFPEIEKFDHLPKPRAEGPTAFVSVMEGCSRYCTFCVVPYTRGEEVSRPVADVMHEVTELARQGVREVNLLGQNVNAYRGPIDDDQADLAELIHYVAGVEGIDRIRYTTSHPVEFGDNLVDAYAQVPELVDHLHLPVQSGSDRVLAAMKRGHTALEYRSKIRKLRAVRPNISLSSDFIVGFPGETDKDFAGTLKLVTEVGYAQAYSFKYSARPGTPAATADGQVPEAEKAARLAALQQLLEAQQAAFNHACIGRTMPVLLDRAGRKPGQMVGRSPWMQAVHVMAPPERFGRIADIAIDRATANSLAGHLAAASTAPPRASVGAGRSEGVRAA